VCVCVCVCVCLSLFSQLLVAWLGVSGSNAAACAGFNVETVEYKNISFTVWDVGGQDKVRRAALFESLLCCVPRC